jgi:hypothetical protein
LPYLDSSSSKYDIGCKASTTLQTKQRNQNFISAKTIRGMKVIASSLTGNLGCISPNVICHRILDLRCTTTQSLTDFFMAYGDFFNGSQNVNLNLKNHMMIIIDIIK